MLATGYLSQQAIDLDTDLILKPADRRPIAIASDNTYYVRLALPEMSFLYIKSLVCTKSLFSVLVDCVTDVTMTSCFNEL